MPRFSDILGQDLVVQSLRRAISSQKVAQAYLFAGPEGVGKMTTATTLAAALNCQAKPGEGCASGKAECISCAKIEQGCHPDFISISPDGAFIKIDQVRTLEQYLGYPPHEGKYRIIVIDVADQMNIHAANALLKSVEEPSPFTIFVLITAAIHRLPPTLVSRCQRLRFVPLTQEAILAVVKQTHALDSSLLQMAATLAGGSLKRALQLVEHENLAAIQQTVNVILRQTEGGNVLELFQAAGESGSDRAFLIEVMDALRLWFRDQLLVLEGLDQGRVLNTQELPRLRTAARYFTRQIILNHLRAVDETQRALRGNVNPVLALENLGLRLQAVSTP